MCKQRQLLAKPDASPYFRKYLAEPAVDKSVVVASGRQTSHGVLSVPLDAKQTAAVLAAALSRVPESADGVGLVQIPAWTSTGENVCAIELPQ